MRNYIRTYVKNNDPLNYFGYLFGNMSSEVINGDDYVAFAFTDDSDNYWLYLEATFSNTPSTIQSGIQGVSIFKVTTTYSADFVSPEIYGLSSSNSFNGCARVVESNVTTMIGQITAIS